MSLRRAVAQPKAAAARLRLRGCSRSPSPLPLVWLPFLERRAHAGGMAHALALVTPLVLAALLPFQGVGREATRLTQARVTPPRLDVAPDLPWASTLQAHGRSYLLTRPVLLKRGAKGSVREGVASLLEAVHRETGCAQKTRRVWDAFVCAHRLHRPQVRALVCV